MLLAVAVGVARWPYPFLPRHLTIISSLTIGIPAFFVALGPNTRRYVPGFVSRVLQFAGRAGFIAATATFVVYAVAREVDHVPLDEARTAATIVLLVVGLWVLAMLARPFTPLRALLLATMAGGFVATLAIPTVRDFFALDMPPGRVVAVIALVAAGAGALLEVTRFRTRR